MSHVDSVSFQTNDFDELQEAITGWDFQYWQMTPGTFEGRVDLSQVGEVQVFREVYNRAIRYQGTTPAGSYAFALPFDQTGMSNYLGRKACVDTLIMQAPDRVADFVSARNLDYLELAAPKEAVLAVASALADPGSFDGKEHGVAKLTPEAAERLRRFGRGCLMRNMTASTEQADIARQCSDQLLKLFVWELVDADDSQGAVVAPGKPLDIVKRATELATSNPSSKIGLTEICYQLGISLRGLHYAFEEVNDMSPATWLRRLRLNYVRKTLMCSDPDEILVKQVAHDYGFTHLGHFARQYLHLFGCLPSDTLRAPPTRKKPQKSLLN